MNYNEDQRKRLINMLNAKEKRAEMQSSLINKWNMTLISFMLNIPGEDKNNSDFVKFHKKYIYIIKQILKFNNISILEEIYFNKSTGMEYFAVVSGDSIYIKKLMIELEEKNEETRFLDIDVFSNNNKQISRDSLNMQSRKCIICNKDAKVCMREKNHSIKELEEKVKNIIIKRCEYGEEKN